jgi:hypothetical protein
MTERRPSHFGDIILPKGWRPGGVRSVHAHTSFPREAAKGRRCLLKSPRRILLPIFRTLVFFNFPKFGAHSAHAFMRWGRTPHLAGLKRICRGCLPKGSKRPFSVYFCDSRARADMRGNPLILCGPWTRAHDAHVFGATVPSRIEWI